MRSAVRDSAAYGMPAGAGVPGEGGAVPRGAQGNGG